MGRVGVGDRPVYQDREQQDAARALQDIVDTAE